MLIIPKGIQIERNEKAEDGLVQKTREWLEKQNAERDTRIHASGLLDPRKSYFDTRYPQPLTDRMVGLFFFGKVLHAFFLSALSGAKGTDWKSDVGSKWSEALKIMWSCDWEKGSIPYEFKTSRSKYEQKKSDLSLYLEQLLIYMCAKGSTSGRLVVLLSNLPAPRGEGWGTYPQYRAYDITVTKKELAEYTAQIVKTRNALSLALKKKDHKKLPLCREFKCGKSQCPHYAKCKPEGRYGTKRFDR